MFGLVTYILPSNRRCLPLYRLNYRAQVTNLPNIILTILVGFFGMGVIFQPSSQAFAVTRHNLASEQTLLTDFDSTNTNEGNSEAVIKQVSSLQLPFIKNEGQIENENVSYYSNTFAGTVFVTKNGELVYALLKFENEAVDGMGYILKEGFVGASILEIEGEQETATKVSYFHGKDLTQWKNSIATFNIVAHE